MAENNEATQWVVDGVHPKTRDEVEFWAEFNGTTIAEALRDLVEAGMILRTQNPDYQLDALPPPAVGYVFRRGPYAVQVSRTPESLAGEAAMKAQKAMEPPESHVRLVPEDELPPGVIQNPDGELIVRYLPDMTAEDLTRRYEEVREWKRHWDEQHQV